MHDSIVAVITIDLVMMLMLDADGDCDDNGEKMLLIMAGMMTMLLLMMMMIMMMTTTMNMTRVTKMRKMPSMMPALLMVIIVDYVGGNVHYDCSL